MIEYKCPWCNSISYHSGVCEMCNQLAEEAKLAAVGTKLKELIPDNHGDHALDDILDELMMMDKRYKSSGWEKMSDDELAEWHMAHVDAQEINPLPGKLLRDRGITIKECAECDHKRMHHNHDYICIPCRRS